MIQAYRLYPFLHLESTVLYLGFFIISILIFLFSIFLIPSIFYFSKDLDTLLVLPLPPQTILAGKFTTCILYEYAFTIIVSIPLLSAYVSNLHPGIFFYLMALVVLLLLPIYPLVLSSILTMLMMRFVPFLKIVIVLILLAVSSLSCWQWHLVTL